MVGYSYVSEEGGEVESGALPHRRQDGWWRVWGKGKRVVHQAHRRTEVALKGSDAGVDGWCDEGGWFGGRDDERFGTWPALQFSFSVLIKSCIAFLILDGRSRVNTNLYFFITIMSRFHT